MRTSLRFASAQKLEMVRLLLAAGADVNAAKTGVRTPLMEAARTRQVAMVKELLGAGARVDATDYEGRTPLWWAVRSVAMRSWGEGPIEETSVKVVSTLLEAGAVVDSRDRDGRTPLFEAAADGHAEEVRVLLASGADPNALAKRPFGGGGTALLEAAARGQAETVGLLLRAGADPTVGEKQGGGALVAAAQSGSVATALTVLDGHMGASAQALRGALLEGARRGNIGLVRLLLERGARLETGDIDGLEVTGDPRILDLLRQE
jgi:ankyrin repeat protein